MKAFVVIEHDSQVSRLEVPCGKLKPAYRWVQSWQVRVVASLDGDVKNGDTFRSFTLADARCFCKNEGFKTALPPMWLVQSNTEEKSPHFFSRSSRRFHDRNPGASRLKVVRLASGEIAVSNGRSVWQWTGDDLHYVS
jgi:hypothetical protein